MLTKNELIGVIIFSMCFLLILEIVYIKLARKLNILDKPISRSSHTEPTVLGGGFIFPIAFAVGGLLIEQYVLSILVLIIAFVGWLDDRKDLSVLIRLPLQFLIVIWMVVDLELGFHFFYLPLIFILVVGWVNTFNFMDGINGISTVYAFVMISSLLFVSASKSNDEIIFLNHYLPWVIVLISLALFTLFNFRKVAICFAGDVGSVSLAFVISILFLKSWEDTESVYLILLPSVYAVDSVFTIFRRLIRKENIFQAHRSHLYQLLSNELDWDHRITSLIYGLTQSIITLIAIHWVAEFSFMLQLCIIFAIYILLIGLYFFSVNKVKRISSNNG